MSDRRIGDRNDDTNGKPMPAATPSIRSRHDGSGAPARVGEQPRRTFLHRLAGVPIAFAAGSSWLAGCGTDATEPTASPDTSHTDVASGGLSETMGGSDTSGADAGLTDTSNTDGGVSDSKSADTKGGTGDAGSADGAVADAAGSDSSGSSDADATNGGDICSTDAQGSGPQPCVSTGADLEGPYYEPKASATTILAGPKEPGERLKVSGRVLGHGCAVSLAGATVEVWQADAAGKYRDLTHATPLRATLTTDCNGGYGFDTVLPGAYLDAGGYRPRHIHFRVTTPAGKILITQLYFAGDPYLSPNDSCGTCKSGDASHIIALKPVGGVKTNHHGIFDIVM